MAVELNHIIVHSTDPRTSAEFLAGVLGVATRPPWGPFIPVPVANGVTLDFMRDRPPFTEQHCAFLMDDAEFDAARRRLDARHVTIWADPGRREAGTVNTLYGGRGLYFDDPDGHLMEVMTVPYGEQPEGRAPGR